MAFLSTKTYGHNEGLSCVFRQPRATHSHCSLLHGYALSFKFAFGCKELDDKNWAVDFGGLKELKQWLKDNFDHTMAVDKADPQLQQLMVLGQEGLADIKVFDGVGCEKFAEHAYNKANEIVQKMTNGRCFCISCEVSEHGANSAIYTGV